MTTPQFRIDENALARWAPTLFSTHESPHEEFGLAPGWDPRQAGEESTVYRLVKDAHDAAVIVPPTPDMEVWLQYDSEDDIYLWIVDFPFRTDALWLRLASATQEYRRIVLNDATGEDAIVAIVREAAQYANDCLRAFAREAQELTTP